MAANTSLVFISKNQVLLLFAIIYLAYIIAIILFGMLYNLMKYQKQAVEEQISDILEKLHSKSIDDMLNFELFNIPNICKSTNLHASVIREHIFKLQSLLSIPFGVRGGQNLQVNVGTLWKKWEQNLNILEQISIEDTSTTSCNFHINRADIVEIIGRANSGKSLLLIEIVAEFMKQGHSVLYLDSSRNQLKLKSKLTTLYSTFASLKNWESRLKIFEFKNMADLSMLLHIIGNLVIEQKKQTEYMLCIDCMSSIDWVDSQTLQVNQYKMIEKLKRLLTNFSEKVGTIVYTYRMPNNFTLFQTTYKFEKQRPKATNTNSRLWDSIALKTICLDYTATKEEKEIMRVNMPKAIDCKVYEFARKIK